MRVLSHARSHMSSLRNPSWGKIFFPVLVFLVFPGAIAYAGFFSFFGDIFTKVNIQEKSINSQNMVLLASAAGPETLTKEVSSEVNTVAESALLADAGPMGGMADIDDMDYDRGQISIYVVREGDSFAAIAKMFDVSVNTILWANNLARGSKLSISQTLAILPVSGVQHTVKKGDTVAGIAKKLRGDADEIRSYNGLAIEDTLEVGTVIIVPDGELPTLQVAPRTTSRLRGASGPAFEGYYQAPLAGYRKTQGLHGYNGVDLAATGGYGSPVMAAAGGMVIISRQGGYNGGYGSYVVIQHSNGTQTLYGHLKSVAVSAGSVVSQGEVIGHEGNSGRSTGTHLHFEIRGAKNPF